MVMIALVAGAAPAQTAFRVLFPELKQQPAPDWVTPGTRLLYTAAAANVGLARDEAGASGGGYTSVDVVAVDEQHAVLDVHSWGLQADRSVVSLGSQGAVELPGAGGDWWLSPKVLAKAPAKARDNLRIVKMPVTVSGQQYNAVRFQDETDEHRFVWVYDLASGRLLQTNSRVGPEAGKRLLTDAKFVAVRHINRPWADADPPAWLADVTGFNVSGQVTTLLPGSPAFSLPMSGNARVTRRGERWLEVALTVQRGSVQNLPPEVTRATLVSGATQSGGLWMPPEGLKALRAGQTIDQDPTLGTREQVTRADGRQVLLAVGSPRDVIESLYDVATGQLVRQRHTTQVGVATMVVDLQVSRQG